MRNLCCLLILAFSLFSCKNKERFLFEKKDPAYTGINFNNEVIENDSVNPLDLEFLYNGGGVAAGDFNNDGLTDLYFTASQVSNRLYLNKGAFQFEDVTTSANVSGEAMWTNGATVVDINGDGLQDIYVCTAIYRDPSRRRNLLYINKGNSKEGIPVFEEQAAAYGIADTGYSVQGAFFDYDNDGDLDLYIVETKLVQRNVAELSGRNPGDLVRIDGDKLYRNDWNEQAGHPVYTDISKLAGITHAGYGLGVAIADINSDGWKDVYVTNDFYDADLLYINDQKGGFTERSAHYFKHTSQNAMGNDIADINGDGLPDVVAVDMNPEDNYRKKKNMSGNNYYVYQTMMAGENSFQYVRNTLQLNMGPRTLGNDSIGDPAFSDIGYHAGIAETDWSWNPSIADFDNDGNRDIFITNGYPRDVTDHDFVSFRAIAGKIASKEALLDEIPQIKVSNYAYQQTGDMSFRNMAKAWGLDEPSFSNGAVYADLDKDGDLDYVVNNINQEAFVYENRLNNQDSSGGAFITVRFKGPRFNPDGLGATAVLHYQGKQLSWENAPVRGYLSCVENKLHFGLPGGANPDSLEITWPGGLVQVIASPGINQELLVDIRNAINVNQAVPGFQPRFASGNEGPSNGQTLPDNRDRLFTDITKQIGLNHTHVEKDFIDFNFQRLLPHKFSEYGPGLAAGDLNGDGLDDLCIGGSSNQPVTILIQQSSGSWRSTPLSSPATVDGQLPETQGILLFDADGDNDLDLFLASGSVEATPGSALYADQFFENDGKGRFKPLPHALPNNFSSKSCVKAADIDHDGDLDIFVGGRVNPGRYPQPLSSYLYRNDSKSGEIRFTDISYASAPALKAIGLTCDALFTDFDNDGWQDLIIAAEWSSLKFLKNNQGSFADITASTGAADFKGWWNSITGGDFDNDGDIDYVAGNLGTNTYYRGSTTEPVKMYAGDFAANDGWVAIPALYLFDSVGSRQEFPAQSRNDIIDQLPALKKKYLTYKSFAGARMSDLLSPSSLQDALKLEANFMQSAYIENKGGGRFLVTALPWQAQIAPVFGMVAEDLDGDGNLDLAICGNDFGAEPAIGRYDAMNGLVLTGDGKGGFSPLPGFKTGFYVPGNAKALVQLRSRNAMLLAASQNRDQLKVFKTRTGKTVSLKADDIFCTITCTDGRKRRLEITRGSSFLSQSSAFILVSPAILSVEATNSQGQRRYLDIK